MLFADFSHAGKGGLLAKINLKQFVDKGVGMDMAARPARAQILRSGLRF